LQAIACGLRVRAVVRPGRNITEVPWFSDANVEIVEMDLADESADFNQFIGGGDTARILASAVIHTAGIIEGTRAEHERITVKPTRRLVDAMNSVGCRKLVHISSISVYGYASMPDDSQLDELTPIEPDLDGRDNYCRAKCQQEAIILQLAQAGLIEATVLRPGVICGYERAWTSRLGVRRAGILIQFNRRGRLPIVFVEHCAKAAILAVQRKEFKSDVYIKPELAMTNCGFEAINIVDDSLPTQEEFIQMLRDAKLSGLKKRFCLPWTFTKRIINGISLLKIFSPAIYSRIPLLLQNANFHARMKGLRYCNARLRDRLGWVPQNNSNEAIVNSWRTQGVKN